MQLILNSHDTSLYVRKVRLCCILQKELAPGGSCRLVHPKRAWQVQVLPAKLTLCNSKPIAISSVISSKEGSNQLISLLKTDLVIWKAELQRKEKGGEREDLQSYREGEKERENGSSICRFSLQVVTTRAGPVRRQKLSLCLLLGIGAQTFRPSSPALPGTITGSQNVCEAAGI